MSDISPISGPAAWLSVGSVTGAAPASESGASAALVDRVELSDVAQILARLPGSRGIRAEKVAMVREAIANGTYETPDKLDRVLDRLMDVLGLR